MIWRSGLLALALLAGSLTGALAHALPGSVLLLQQQGTALRLTVKFPLAELLIAAPALADLEEVMYGREVPPATSGALAHYLGQHLSVRKDGAPLPMSLTGAHVQPVYQKQLGGFGLVVSEWTIPNAGSDPAALLLSYDAIMHEVRNHRATVQWVGPGGAARQIAEFGFFGALGGVSLSPPLSASNQN